MTTTLKAIVRKAMQKSGILTKTEEPSADEYSDAVDSINGMLSSWSNDSMMIIARSWETFNPATAKLDYTMGPGGDFDTIRPLKIVACTVTVGATDNPVKVINDDIYFEQIPFKNIPGVPDLVNFDNAFPLMNVRFYPYPLSTYPVNFLTEKELTLYGLNDEVSLPAGWERAIIFNGAVEISSDYGQTPPAETVQIAAKSLGLIRKSINMMRSMDAQPQTNDSGNIYQGWWYR